MADNNSVYLENPDIYKKEIKPVPKQKLEIGIDTDKTVFLNIIQTGTASTVDINSLNSFTHISLGRDQVLSLIDSMCEDTKIAAVLETYAEDATDYNDEGRIVWCEASDPNILGYITFLLDSINVDKHIYKWVYCLCKYGDVYLRLYRKSEVDADDILNPSTVDKKEKTKLTEAVKAVVHKTTDLYVNYVEMVHNPATCFELVKFGKTQAYIKTSLESLKNSVTDGYTGNAIAQMLQYKFSKEDIELYEATDFVHGSLEDNSHRTPEVVSLFTDNNKDQKSTVKQAYTVRRGQSLLYNTFKTWRELSLLENSLLLNRVTKSSIVRIISVEVGDMPKEMVGPHLQGIKSLIELKSAITAGGSLQEYTNPGPIENNIYVPTHNQVGTITTSEIGGNPEVKNIVDIDYYLNQLYGGLRVPKQYFGQTDDSAGFSGGQSLSIISSRYAKMIKRIQNTIILMIYDLVNLYLVDRKLSSYINKFTIKMQAPTTLEEIDRRANLSTKVQLVRDIMDMLAEVPNVSSKLSILKSMLSNVITNTEVLLILEDEILALKEQENPAADVVDEVPTGTDLSNLSMPTPDLGGGGGVEEPAVDMNMDIVGGGADIGDLGSESLTPVDTGNAQSEVGGSELILPTPADLGLDLT